MPKYSRTFLPAIAVAGAVALAPEGAGASAPDDKSIYDRIVSLAGDWTGHMEDPLAGPPVTVRYEVASGGKAVIEYQNPAGSLPSVTVYFLASGKLRAVQYSPAGNQPAYKLGGESTDELVHFEFDGGHLWTSGSALITDDTRVGVNLGSGYRWLYDSNIIGVHGLWIALLVGAVGGRVVGGPSALTALRLRYSTGPPGVMTVPTYPRCPVKRTLI